MSFGASLLDDPHGILWYDNGAAIFHGVSVAGYEVNNFMSDDNLGKWNIGTMSQDSNKTFAAKLTVLQNGSVGIGTVDPTTRLHTYVADSWNQTIIESGLVGSSAACQLLTPEGKWILENR